MSKTLTFRKKQTEKYHVDFMSNQPYIFFLFFKWTYIFISTVFSFENVLKYDYISFDSKILFFFSYINICEIGIILILDDVMVGIIFFSFFTRT